MIRSIIYAVIGVLMTGLAFANPVNLEAPSNSIGAADSYGNLRLWREIDEVDFGDGLVLPLRAEFSSANHNPSPYAGYGWFVPLLESRAFLKREAMMEVTLLCGKSLFLRRNRADPTKFQNLERDWTAALNGENIILSHEDGWMLHYFNGQISQMKTDKGRVLIWDRQGSLVTGIREQGVQTDSFKVVGGPGGIPVGMDVNGKRHTFKLGNRQRVQEVNGQTLIAGIEPSLSSWAWPDGKEEHYVFEIEQSPSITPGLTVTDREGVSSKYKWDAGTNTVLSDGQWTYTVGEIPERFNLPRISRKNAAGEEEFIQVDNLKGITEIQTLEGGAPHHAGLQKRGTALRQGAQGGECGREGGAHSGSGNFLRRNGSLDSESGREGIYDAREI